MVNAWRQGAKVNAGGRAKRWMPKGRASRSTRVSPAGGEGECSEVGLLRRRGRAGVKVYVFGQGSEVDAGAGGS